MTFGATPFGAAPFAAAGAEAPAPSEVYSRTLGLNLIVCAGTAVRPRLFLRESVFERFTPALGLTLQVHAPRTTPVLPLKLSVFGTVTPVLGLALTVNAASAAPVAGETYVWAAKVVLAGVDVSARLTGQIEIDADEDSARTARVSLAPAGGALAMVSLAKALIAIDLIRHDSAGVTTGIYRLFTGWVDTPNYDAATRVLNLTCTDARQAKILAMTRAQIDALVPGKWSPFVFDRYATSEQYLADRLSTVAGSVDADAFGTLRFTPWAGAPDRVFTEADVVDASLQATVDSTASRRKTVLTLTYRYPQAKVRGIHFRYEAPSISQMFYLGLRALTRNAVEQALNGSGATVVGSINYQEYPTTSLVQASGGMGVVLADPTSAAQLCMAATAVLNRRYSRWIDEQWTVAIGADGTQSEESRVISVEWDPTESDTRKPPTNAMSGFLRLMNDSPLPYLPERLAPGENVLDYVPPGQPDATAFTLAYQVSVLAAAKQVAETQRDASIHFSTPLDPTITLQTFAAVDTDQVSGGGKVKRVRHLLDIASGSALTDVELCCVGVSLPSVPAPSRPTIPNAIKQGALLARAETWIGGMVESRPWNEDVMFGYCTNSTSIYAPAAAPRYPEQFSVFVPGIEEAAQGAVAVPPTCDMISGSAVIAHLSSMDGFAKDVYITGTGIPADTKILSVDTTGQTATLSHPVTLTAKAVEVRLAVRQYIDRRRVAYNAIITRLGPTIGV